jgi:hypothetical protein
MLELPQASLKLLGLMSIPNDLRQLPNNDLLKIIVEMASEYRSLVPDLHKPQTWTSVRCFISEYRAKLNIVSFSHRLYEHDSYLGKRRTEYLKRKLSVMSMH